MLIRYAACSLRRIEGEGDVGVPDPDGQLLIRTGGDTGVVEREAHACGVAGSGSGSIRDGDKGGVVGIITGASVSGITAGAGDRLVTAAGRDGTDTVVRWPQDRSGSVVSLW